MIVLRKDLNMRKGKMVAQGAHAAVDVVTGLLSAGHDHLLDAWKKEGGTKICVGVNSEEELLHIRATARQRGLHASLIQDAGRTEFNGVPTYTAVAIQPYADAEIDIITGHLPLL